MTATADIGHVSIPRRFNVTTMLLDRQLERGFGHRIALLHAAGSVTYAELFSLVNRTGNLLRSIGLLPEERLLIAADNSVEAVVTWLAAIRIGAVPVMVNFFGDANTLDYYLRDTGATVAAVDRYGSAWADKWSTYPRLRTVLFLGEAPAIGVAFREGAQMSEELDPFDNSPDDPAFWLYSSGSTGAPKGCVHLHHDLSYHVQAGAGVVLPCSPEDVCFSPAKLFFGIGLAENLWRPLSYGAAAALVTGRSSAVSFLDAIQRFRATEVFAVPTLFAHVVAMGASADHYDFQSVRRWMAGGEPLPPAVSIAWQGRFGLPIDVAFGSNESAFVYLMTSAGNRKHGSSGVRVPGVTLRLTDQEGRPVPQGQVGELNVKHDAFAAFYWKNHTATKQNMQGEWFRSDDLFFEDEEGHFFFQGRRDDMFKVSGQWVSPIEVEAAIKKHPAVVECAVVGATDASGIAKSKAFLILTADGDCTWVVEELKEQLLMQLPGFKIPASFEVRSDLPRTGTGKLDRRALTSSFAGLVQP